MTVDDCTSLRCDHHPRITTFGQLCTEQRLLNQIDDLFRRTCSNQDFVERVVINGVQQILAIRLFRITRGQLLDDNFRRKNVTLVNKFGCRNIANDLTIDLRIIHPWFEYSQRMFRSRSKEILSVSTEYHVLSGRKEVPFDTVVCLIKVDVIYLNLTLINFVERVVGSKDQRRTIVLPAKVIEIYDCINFSGSKVCSLTTVNVQNLNIFNVNVLKELRTELFCQENTRSNYNNSRNIKSINSINGVSDHAHCLTATSRYNDLSTIVFKHCVTCFTLMGTELHNLVSMNV